MWEALSCEIIASVVFASTAFALVATAEPANNIADIVSKPDKRLFINTSITYTSKPNSKYFRLSMALISCFHID